MVISRFLAGLFAAVFFCVAAPAQSASAQAAVEKPLWPHQASDIAPDPAVTFGVLPNGMRYALMKNQLPPGAVSIRFSLKFGSLYEADAEKGLAHFIEHMAFNGSTNVPEGDMVRILERLGLAFGADTNASTGQEHTTYMLELPNASDTLVDESLFLIRELASELTFNAEAIDRERGIVLAEWRRGDNFARRRNEQQLNFLIPGSYAASRMPIGEPKVIESAQRDHLVSLYDRYYRPERATLVMVGDFDVEAMEKKIAMRFGDWKGRGEAGKEPDLSYTPPERPSAASVFTHKDGGDAISVYSLMPFREEPDTAAQRRADNLLMFAIAALSRRLAPMANAEDPPFRSAGLSTGDMLDTVKIAGGSVSLTPDSWKPGLQALEQEWRRAFLYGFTQDEVDRQIEALRTGQQNQSQREKTRTTGALVSGLLASIQNETVFATPSSGLARFEGWADEVTPEMVHGAFRTWMKPEPPLLFFMSSSVERPGVEKEIVAAWEESAAIEVRPPAAKTAMRFAYTDFGKPGTVVKDTRLEDIDVRLITFSNNVRLNLKKTEFQRNSVQVSLRVGHGALDFPDKPFGLSSIMGAFSSGGLERHSIDDLRTILTGRQVSTRFGGSTSYFGGTYFTTPADLELQLQLAAAFVMHPGYRPEAERRWRQSVTLAWPRLDANAGTVWSAKGMRLLTSGDKRFGTDPDDGDVLRSFTELKAYLDPVLQRGPIEIAIVGDIDEQKAIEAVAKTFGALPMRDPAPTKFRSDRPVVFRRDKAPIVLTHNGEANQALASIYWPVDIDPDADPQGARVVTVLAAIMRLKVTAEIREALGATYSPAVSSSLSSVYPGFGYVSARAEVRPEDIDVVLAALEKIAASMRAGEFTEDEFSRAITPSLETLPQSATSNSYWLSVIDQAQSRPDLMERSKIEAIEKSVRAVTREDVIAAANAWLTEAGAQIAKVLPSPKSAPQAEAPAAPG